MRSVCKTLTMFAFVCTSLMSSAYGQGVTRFTVVDSSPTSWVARGLQNYTVTPSLGWTFEVDRNFDNGVGFYIHGPALPGTSIDYWRLDFAAPFNAELTEGVYADFQRWPFQDVDRPGLWFASTGRGDNMASGTFEVLEATYGPDGEVLTFAADFIHYGENILERWAICEIRYNAQDSDPLPPVEYEVEIDIQLGDPDNQIQLGKKKPKPVDVVLFGSDLVAVQDISIGSLTLGDPTIENGLPTAPDSSLLMDVDNDGYEDLYLTFDLGTMETNASIDDQSLVLQLNGTLSSGDLVVGADVVSVSQPGKKGKGNNK